MLCVVEVEEDLSGWEGEKVEGNEELSVVEQGGTTLGGGPGPGRLSEEKPVESESKPEIEIPAPTSLSTKILLSESPRGPGLPTASSKSSSTVGTPGDSNEDSTSAGRKLSNSKSSNKA